MLLIFWCVLLPVTVFTLPGCQQGENCRLPECFCTTFQHTMDREAIPQMVYFGFDDGVTEMLGQYYNRLFPENRTNPNGCPISMTLYVSGDNTDYHVLIDYFNRGFEMAVHSTSHAVIDTAEKVQREAAGERDNLVTLANISEKAIVGWRSPYLHTAGDAQVDVLQKLGFTYDISLTYTRAKMADPNPWPFTLDYGWTLPCEIYPCLLKNHPGFWEIPVNSMRDYRDWAACSFLDACRNKPQNENQTYKYIMDNFYSHYNGNRAPFGIHLHAAWFENNPHHVNAMDRAILDMLKKYDVYIVNVQQVIEWMKRPTELHDIKYFKPWRCGRTWKSTVTFKHVFLFVMTTLIVVLYVIVMKKLF